MEKFNNALEHANLDEGSRALVTDEEVTQAMADLDLDIPNAEKADMDSSPVTQEEMNAAVEALSEPEVQVEHIEEFQPPADDISQEKEVSIATPEIMQREEEVQERIMELKQSLEEVDEESELDSTIADGGNNTNGTIENVSQIDPGGRRWSEWGTSYERMHGNDTVEIFKKAFGGGLSALFNLFRPSKWKKYNKMLSEHNDDSLTKKTSFTRDSEGNEKHWTHF